MLDSRGRNGILGNSDRTLQRAKIEFPQNRKQEKTQAREVTEVKQVGRLFAAVSIVVGILLGCSLAVAAEEGAPRVKDLKFIPERPETGDFLKLQISLEGSAIRAEVKVFNNNDEVVATYYDGIAEYFDVGDRFKAGDKVRAQVVPLSSDGLAGDSKSLTVEIVNAPPSAKLVDQKITGNTYSAHIEAKDPEGDPITYSIKQGPPGLVVDQNGNLDWKIGQTTSGSFPIAISVKDSRGAEVVMSYTIGVRREQGRSGP